ncbi:type II toxin-antitoxin system HicA family toxin [Candidatus Peregrinibacteria bacterium]|nr:type II toxin-antitoxin system HicA family toxin [Candidatus Peregrinibacteria bacterium]MBI3816097.1 type II toxin-antitoxin system HicA family toxin [Candidatus Peregrinibacteria bacterium]
MPKLPRTSAERIIRTLEALGFCAVRQRGSHVVLRRGDRGCVVPMHREVAIGTLGGILRQANVSSEEFVEAFR